MIVIRISREMKNSFCSWRLEDKHPSGSVPARFSAGGVIACDGRVQLDEGPCQNVKQAADGAILRLA